MDGKKFLLSKSISPLVLVPFSTNIGITIVRKIIPRPEDKIPITWKVTPELLYPFVVVFLQAHLVQKANTKLLRRLLFPISFLGFLRFGFAYTSRGRQYMFLNFLRGMFKMKRKQATHILDSCNGIRLSFQGC